MTNAVYAWGHANGQTKWARMPVLVRRNFSTGKAEVRAWAAGVFEALPPKDPAARYEPYPVIDAAGNPVAPAGKRVPSPQFRKRDGSWVFLSETRLPFGLYAGLTFHEVFRLDAGDVVTVWFDPTAVNDRGEPKPVGVRVTDPKGATAVARGACPDGCEELTHAVESRWQGLRYLDWLLGFLGDEYNGMPNELKARLSRFLAHPRVKQHEWALTTSTDAAGQARHGVHGDELCFDGYGDADSCRPTDFDLGELIAAAGRSPWRWDGGNRFLPLERPDRVDAKVLPRTWGLDDDPTPAEWVLSDHFSLEDGGAAEDPTAPEAQVEAADPDAAAWVDQTWAPDEVDWVPPQEFRDDRPYSRWTQSRRQWEHGTEAVGGKEFKLADGAADETIAPTRRRTVSGVKAPAGKAVKQPGGWAEDAPVSRDAWRVTMDLVMLFDRVGGDCDRQAHFRPIAKARVEARRAGKPLPQTVTARFRELKLLSKRRLGVFQGEPGCGRYHWNELVPAACRQAVNDAIVAARGRLCEQAKADRLASNMQPLVDHLAGHIERAMYRAGDQAECLSQGVGSEWEALANTVPEAGAAIRSRLGLPTQQEDGEAAARWAHRLDRIFSIAAGIQAAEAEELCEAA